jgi:hypothetical protein
MSDENSEKEENINLRNKKQVDRAKWQRECREREKKRPVYYDNTGYWKEKEKVCEFCTRTVYFDSHHLKVSNGEWFPHDRHYKQGEKGVDVKHHVTHCIGIYGTKEQKELCKKLRQIKGMPEPWYNENPDRLKKAKEEGKIEINAVEKDDNDKKIIPKENIATLDEFAEEEDEPLIADVTTADKKYKHVIEIESDAHTIPAEIMDTILGYYNIGNLVMVTKENKR